tara:strand:+ start:203 stop:676 length:474 start_codon:yes stop_codon:yes gene_type:complete
MDILKKNISAPFALKCGGNSPAKAATSTGPRQVSYEFPSTSATYGDNSAMVAGITAIGNIGAAATGSYKAGKNAGDSGGGVVINELGEGTQQDKAVDTKKPAAKTSVEIKAIKDINKAVSQAGKTPGVKKPEGKTSGAMPKKSPKLDIFDIGKLISN